MEINSSANVYEQIVEHYRKYITLGILTENEKLPSSRELAIKIGVNAKTVEKAYSKLVEEGLIYNVPKKGFYVKGKTNHDNAALSILDELKKKGYKKEELLEYLDKIYGGNEDDSNK